MNSVNISGRLAGTPELKKTSSGKSVTSFDVAVKRPFSKDVTDWIAVVCWNQSAEYVCRYGEKGSFIEVDGTIQTRTYTDKHDNKRKAVEVVAERVSFVEGKSSSGSDNATTGRTGAVNGSFDIAADFEEILDDGDLPF